MASTAPGLDLFRATRGVGATLSAHPDGLAFDVAVRLDPSELDQATRLQLDQPVDENGVLGFVPADACAVATQQGLDETLKQAVDQLLTTPEGELIRRRIGVDDTGAPRGGPEVKMEDLDVSGHDDPVPGRSRTLGHGVRARLRGGRRCRDRRSSPVISRSRSAQDLVPCRPPAPS
jgi:hypothetical protein